MTTKQTFVIAGASLAGAKAAESLRAEGFDGRVVLIGEEAVRPYERPPLSKAYLRGEVGFEKAAVHEEALLPRARDRASHLNHSRPRSTSVSKQVTLDPGGRLNYEPAPPRHGSDSEACNDSRRRPRRDPLLAKPFELRCARARRLHERHGSWSSEPVGSARRWRRPPVSSARR